MTTLDELFGPGRLQEEIDAGHVRRGRSGDGLSIYNYTEACQYGHHWNEVTLRCRGLIAEDEGGIIVGWCYPKMFNHAEHGHDNPWAPNLPIEPFEIFDKVDGSLAILFWDIRQNRWRVASRGSFNSEQAEWAQAWIDREDEGGLVTRRLTPGFTYLAEILFPSNRIVVSYGGREDLVLHGVYNGLGDEYPLGLGRRTEWRPIGSVVRSWPALPVSKVVEAAAGNRHLTGAEATGTDAEGWMLRYASGLRVKIKIDAYVKYHKLFTGVSERTIWGILSSGGDPQPVFELMPDEFHDWVQNVSDRLRAGHNAYVVAAHVAYASIFARESRKEFAGEATKSSMSAALFRLYDGRTIDEMAWRSVEPRGDTSFATDEA